MRRRLRKLPYEDYSKMWGGGRNDPTGHNLKRRDHFWTALALTMIVCFLFLLLIGCLK